MKATQLLSFFITISSILVSTLVHADIMHLKKDKYIAAVTVEAKAKGNVIFTVEENLYKIPEALIVAIDSNSITAETPLPIEQLKSYMDSFPPEDLLPLPTAINNTTTAQSEPEGNSGSAKGFLEFELPEVTVKLDEGASEFILGGTIGFAFYSMTTFNEVVERNNRYFKANNLNQENLLEYGMNYNLLASWRYRNVLQMGLEVGMLHASVEGGTDNHGQKFSVLAAEAEALFRVTGQVSDKWRLGIGFNMGAIAITGKLENDYTAIALGKESINITGTGMSFKFYGITEYKVTDSIGLSATLGLRSANVGRIKLIYNDTADIADVSLNFGGPFLKTGVFLIF